MVNCVATIKCKCGKNARFNFIGKKVHQYLHDSQNLRKKLINKFNELKMKKIMIY
jgi:hypothetical protein